MIVSKIKHFLNKKSTGIQNSSFHFRAYNPTCQSATFNAARPIKSKNLSDYFLEKVIFINWHSICIKNVFFSKTNYQLLSEILMHACNHK